MLITAAALTGLHSVENENIQATNRCFRCGICGVPSGTPVHHIELAGGPRGHEHPPAGDDWVSHRPSARCRAGNLLLRRLPSGRPPTRQAGRRKAISSWAGLVSARASGLHCDVPQVPAFGLVETWPGAVVGRGDDRSEERPLWT